VLFAKQSFNYIIKGKTNNQANTKKLKIPSVLNLEFLVFN
jgi:hypothetical protein